MLYLPMRSIPYLQLGVAFLCTRVEEPDKDDWKNLTRFIRYIQSVMGLPLIVGIDNTNMLRKYVDTAFRYIVT